MKRLKKRILCVLMSLVMAANIVSPVFATQIPSNTELDVVELEDNIDSDIDLDDKELNVPEIEDEDLNAPQPDETELEDADLDIPQPDLEEDEIESQDSGESEVDVSKVDIHSTLSEDIRVLYEDDFSSNNSDAWNVSSPNICTFEGGKAHIKGGGPENRIALKDKILAHNMNISLDLWVNSGNTNCNIKFGLKSEEGYDSRHQVRFDTVNGILYIEKVGGGNTENFARTNFPLPSREEPYKIEIDIDGDSITVFVDEEEALTAEDTGIKDVAMGYFLIACQFPNQDISIDNLLITTTDEPVGDKYQLTLKTVTDGVEDEAGAEVGGTISADVMEGYEGDLVTLTPEAKPGYIFDKYTSYLTDSGNSTDGLLDIINNKLRFNSKTGNITVVAHFITEPEDPNLLFRDRFYDDLNSHGKYDIYDEDNAVIEDGKLKISASDSGANYILLDGSEWVDESLGQGYSIEFDVAKANSEPGTFQMAFRTNDFSERYVLALNGDLALLRRFEEGVNNELVRVRYSFDKTARRIRIDVQDNTVSIYSDGQNIITYKNKEDDKDKENWADVNPGLGIINMTQGAPVFVDNIAVRKQLPVAPINIKVMKDGEDDPSMLSGTVVATPSEASAGETVTLTSTAKPGYKLEGYTLNGNEFNEETFVMPDDVTNEGVTIVANFVTVEYDREATTFYIDSENGDDNNDGESPETPWKSLEKLHPDSPEHVVLIPGDNVRFKTGSVFTGEDAELRFNGSGLPGKPITIGVYGDGPRPRFDGAGAVENVVSTYNQEYITIEGLEITNLHPRYNSSFDRNTSNNRAERLRAVNIFARDYGVVSGIHLKDLYIHSVNGDLSAKWNGGIFFDITGSVRGGEIQGVPTKYDDILIEDCTIERVDRSGIKLVSSVWCNQSLTNNPNVPINWYPSTGVVVRGNVIKQVGGDGITVRDTENALVEYNVVGKSRHQNTGYNAGIWPFEAVGTVVQYNESYLTGGTQDGQGFDCDHLSSYTIMQYNYSHDNEGGFMLLMNGFPHTAPTVRYNISQNDKDKTFEFARGSANGTMIYNNTIYSNAVLTGRAGVFDMANSVAGTGNRPFYVFNNIFWYPENQQFYCGEVNNTKENIRIYNNAYLGGITPPEEEENPITADISLASPGEGPSTNSGIEDVFPRTGKYLKDELDGYKLVEGSELIDAGVTVDDILQKYGGEQKDYRHLTPVELHEEAKKGESIDFAVGSNFPEIAGVRYDLDFFGNPMISGEKPDIGAMEFQFTPTEETKSNLTISPKTVTVEAGEKQQFTAELYIDDIKSDKVIWSLKGGTSSNIDDKGLLTVGKDEKDEKLTVIATAIENEDLTDTAVVTVVTPSEEPSEEPGGGSSNGGGSGIKDNPKEKQTEIKVRPVITDNGLMSAVVSKSDIKALADTKDITITVPVDEKDKNTDIAISIPGEIANKNIEKIHVNIDDLTFSLNPDVIRDNSGSKNQPVTLNVKYMDKNELNISKEESNKSIDNLGYNISLKVGEKDISKFNLGDSPVIVLPYTPKANELNNVNSLVVYRVQDNGTLKSMPSSAYDANKKGMVFRATELGKYVIGINNVTFEDVLDSHWAKSHIDILAARGIVNGMSIGKFEPRAEVTRAQFITMLLRAFDLNMENPVTKYVDVAPGTWYYDIIATAEKYNLFYNINSNTIKPNESITREEMAYILNEFISLYGFKSQEDTNKQEFKDIGQTSDWAKSAVLNMKDYGILNGRGENMFMPKESLTRAEAAVVIVDILKLLK